jgi:hypothetical protein
VDRLSPCGRALVGVVAVILSAGLCGPAAAAARVAAFGESVSAPARAALLRQWLGERAAPAMTVGRGPVFRVARGLLNPEALGAPMAVAALAAVIHRGSGLGVSVSGGPDAAVFRPALATAGVQDADIRLVFLQRVPAVFGLVTAVAAYQGATGSSLTWFQQRTAARELLWTLSVRREVSGDQSAAALTLALLLWARRHPGATRREALIYVSRRAPWLPKPLRRDAAFWMADASRVPVPAAVLHHQVSALGEAAAWASLLRWADTVARAGLNWITAWR